ncbi:unnamed protein product [Rotaria sp. Silwood1]|nr:unnamed protein product [Rotaria sp. Silwood1]
MTELINTNGDGIIAVGGGSPIDAAKLIVYLYKEETGRLLKLISIPTTLSAAEYTIIAGYTDVEARQRALIGAWLSLWPDERITALGPSHSLGHQLGSP